MSELARMRAASSVVPTLRYRDLDAAVAWLCASFGFQPHTVLRASDGGIASAQLVHGTGMIILAPVGSSEFDALMKQPDEIGGAETQSAYFLVADADAHYATACANGAEIVLELQNFEHGGRGYLCRDPQGHLWSFGTYDPWGSGGGSVGWRNIVADAADWLRQHLPAHLPANVTLRHVTAAAASLALLLLAGAAALGAWWASGSGAPVDAETLTLAQQARSDAERRASAAEAQLARLDRERDAIEVEDDKLQEQVTHMAGAKEAAEAERQRADAAMRKLATELEQLRLAKAASERAIRHLTARSVRDRQAASRARRQAAALTASINAHQDAAKRNGASQVEMKARFEREAAHRKEVEAGRTRVEQLLAEEREARAQAETGLQQISEQLQKEQAARRAAELAQQNPVPTPRPAVRPDR